MSEKELQTNPESEAEVNETPAGEGAAAAQEDEKLFKFIEDPTFAVEHKGNCAYEVKVSIPAVNETAAHEEILAEVQDEIEMPGFRRGRTPRKVIEKKLGKGLRDQTYEKLVDAAFRKLVKEHDLKPFSTEKAEGLEEAAKREPGTPIELTLKFEVMPRVTLGEYRGLEVERPFITIDEKDIDESIENVRRSMAVFETVADAEAADGDQVIMSFAGTIGGVAFQGGSADNYPYMLGSKRFFPEFEKALAGQKAGADLECNVDFPANYGNADVAGKAAHFKIKVNEIKRRTMPEPTDAFAQQAGYEDMADMRAKTAEALRKQTDETSQNMAEQNAVTKAVEVSTFELPESLLKSSAHNYYEDSVKRLRSMRVPASDIESREEELQKNAREQAESEVKEYFLLREIARAEDLSVTESDFESEAEAISRRTGYNVSEVLNTVQSQENRETYADRLLRRKAAQLILAAAKVVDKELPREEAEEEK